MNTVYLPLFPLKFYALFIFSALLEFFDEIQRFVSKRAWMRRKRLFLKWYVAQIIYLRENLAWKNIKSFALRQFYWCTIKHRLYIFICAWLIVFFVIISPLGIMPARAEPLSLGAAAIICAGGIVTSMVIYLWTHQGYLPGNWVDWAELIGVGCLTPVVFVLVGIPGAGLAAKAALMEVVGLSLSNVAGTAISVIIDQTYEHFLRDPLLELAGIDPGDGSNKEVANNISEIVMSDSGVQNGVDNLISSFESSYGESVTAVVPDLGFSIVSPENAKVFQSTIVHASFSQQVISCGSSPDSTTAIQADVLYVQFGYSTVMNQNSVSLLVSDNANENNITNENSTDYDGCNDGWSLDFNMRDSGITNPFTGYLAARAMDVTGTLTPWVFSNLVTFEPRFSHDYSVSNLQFSNPSPNVGDTVQVTTTITNVGASNEGSTVVEFYKNGVYQTQANISALAQGASTTATFSFTAQEGAYTYAIKSALSTDEDPANNMDQGSIVVGTAPSLKVSGSTSPSPYQINVTTDGGTGNYSVTVQNGGSASTNVTVSKSGTRADWVTLGTAPGTMQAYSTKTFSFSTNIPAGQSVGTQSANIIFTWSGSPITLPIEFNIVDAGNGHDEYTFSPSTATIDGDMATSTVYHQPDYPYETTLDNFTSTAYPTNITRTIDLTESEYYRIKAETANELSVNLDEIQAGQNAGLWYQLGTFETTKYDDFAGLHSIYRYLAPGSNPFKFSLNGNATGNDTQWDLTYSLGITVTKNAWWASYNPPAAQYNLWKAGWVNGYVCATINSVSRAGDVVLFNNKVPVRTMAISAADVGDEVCWRVTESNLIPTNTFNFKANLGGAQVTMSNIHWVIDYLVGKPLIQATRSLSFTSANINQNVIATLSFKNVGTNFAEDPTYNDSLPSGLQQVSGSLSGTAASSVNPGATATATYTFKGAVPGPQLIPGSVVSYNDPSNFYYYTTMNNTVVDVWGGTLQPVMDILENGVAGTPFDLTASITDSITSTSVSSAQVIATVTLPDTSTKQVVLTWNGGLNKYVGSFFPLQAGEYQISLSASKPYYVTGGSPDVSWYAKLPNQKPIAFATYAQSTSDTPNEVILDASNTVDVDGVLTSYEWDINNDGSVNTTGRVVSWIFPSEGSYPVKLTVTDNDGAISTYVFIVNVGLLTVDIPVQSGWNLISQPLNPSSTITAESLCVTLGANVLEINRWNAGGWDSHICGLPFNNFNIDVGKGYFVRANGQVNWNAAGTGVSGLFSIEFSGGWNLISLPLGATYTAESLGDAINLQGGTCTEINRWYAGGWDSHIINLPFNDFTIQPGAGYFVKCQSASSFSLTLP